MFKTNKIIILSTLTNFHNCLITFGIIPIKFQNYITAKIKAKPAKFLQYPDVIYRVIALGVFFWTGFVDVEYIFAQDKTIEFIYSVIVAIVIRLTLFSGLIFNVTCYQKFARIFKKLYKFQNLYPINYLEIRKKLNFMLIFASLRLCGLMASRLSFLDNAFDRVYFAATGFNVSWIILLQCQATGYLWVVYLHLGYLNTYLIEFRGEKVTKILVLIRDALMELTGVVEEIHKLFVVTVGLRLFTDMVEVVAILYRDITDGGLSLKTGWFLVEPMVATVWVILAYHLVDCEVCGIFGSIMG